MTTTSTPPTPASLCPLCGGATYEIACKIYCSRCHALIATCEEGDESII